MNFYVLFAIYVGFYSFIYPSEDKEHLKAAPTSVAAPFPQKLMGIEIETSTLKLSSPTASKIGFYFRIPSDGKCIWILEEDTLDPTFSESADLKEFDQNVEIKTHGGFTFEAINEVAADLEMMIVLLYERALHAPFEANPQLLEEMQNHKYKVTPKRRPQTPFLIKSKEFPLEDQRAIKPQITYQLPLQEILRIFERLKGFEHQGITYLMRDLSAAPFTITDSQTIAEKLKGTRLQRISAKLLQNKDAGEPVRRYFHDVIGPQFAAMPKGPMKGFTLLFLHYWYELFNNKNTIGSEPGLKQYLGIMSRIPLSQLYDSLEAQEKIAFQQFMEPHVNFGNQCTLRAYLDEGEKATKIPLTLTHWFSSIIDDQYRQSVNSRSVDLLSPPPFLPAHSMGILDMHTHANNVALIEVRGYGELKYDGRNLTIYRIRELVNGESRWFFNVL